tara:strand:- start:591 stop:779 length:189 start_codon:yes stop_codon:yes gene_type:complete
LNILNIHINYINFYNLRMQILFKNELWMIIFSIGLLYWLFNPSLSMTLVMILPLLIAANAKK